MNLYDAVRDALRTKHYAYKTEKTYLHWIRKYVQWLKPRHPREAGAEEVRKFVTYLAVERNVIASTQTQALAAVTFGRLLPRRKKHGSHMP
jgi:site-specific recombinase XerD